MTLQADNSQTLNAPAPDQGSAPAPAIMENPAAPAPQADPAPATEASWRDSLPDEYKVNPTIQRFQDPAALAKSYLELNSMMGAPEAQIARIPSNDDEKAWNDLYSKLGRPEDKAGYDLSFDFPEGIEEDTVLSEAFREAAHKHGLSKKQAEGIFKDVISMQAESLTQSVAEIEAAKAAAEQALRKEWGAAFESKVESFKEIFAKDMDQEFVEFLEETGAGNHPGLMRFLDRLAGRLGEDTIRERSTAAPVYTPGEASALINQKYGDQEFMKQYTDKNHPSHSAAVAEMERLFKLSAGQKG